MFKYWKNFIVYLCLLGVVDQVHGDIVLVEITSPSGEYEQLHMPLWIFPCEVKDGEYFYIQNLDGITEVRCGEPPQ